MQNISGQNSIPQIPVLRLNEEDVTSLKNDIDTVISAKKTSVYEAQADLNYTNETVTCDGVFHVKTTTVYNIDGLETSVLIEYYTDEDLTSLNSKVEYKYSYDKEGNLILETQTEINYDAENNVISIKKTETKYIPGQGLSSKYTTEKYFNHEHTVGTKVDTSVYDDEGKRILDVTRIYDSQNKVNWSNE